MTLLSAPMFPRELMYTLWVASRGTGPLIGPERIHQVIQNPTLIPSNFDHPVLEAFGFTPDEGGREALKADVDKIFAKVLNENIPIIESLHFVFMLEGISISFREQMVRHRVGVKLGEQLGADLVPDLGDSTWWSQSMRVLDMGTFADEENFRMPEALLSDPLRMTCYKNAMRAAQDHYNNLVQLGVPREEAREVIPLGATHRISWALNLAALKHILGKRSCWILQAELWGPVAKGMVDGLTEVDPAFASLVNPPCVKKGCYTACPFELSNGERLQGKEQLTPCPLWLNKQPDQALAAEAAVDDSAWKSWPSENDETISWRSFDAKREALHARTEQRHKALWGWDITDPTAFSCGPS